MADYADRLLSIADKRKKLLEEEAKLIEKRKVEIGALAEKLGLLTISDELLSGIFQEAKQAIDKKSEKIKEWEKLGAQSNNLRSSKIAKNTHAKQHAQAT
ncbi:MAG: hypothetical protein K2Q14_07160 [Gammaproteobacteria bacterium]|nr:hypothetical protein [Gammaproteobacteria bacterium]